MLRMDAGPGIYLQMLTDLFQAVEETRESTDCSVSMSCLEIYNEVIWDLLKPSSGFLDLREDSRGSIQIAGIAEVSASNTQELSVTGAHGGTCGSSTSATLTSAHRAEPDTQLQSCFRAKGTANFCITSPLSSPVLRADITNGSRTLPSASRCMERVATQGPLTICPLLLLSSDHAAPHQRQLAVHTGVHRHQQDVVPLPRRAAGHRAPVQPRHRHGRGSAHWEALHGGPGGLGAGASDPEPNRGKRMKEGVPINRSLLALGNCINALSEKGGSQAQYVNFRDANSRAPAAGQAQPAERVLPHRTVRGRHLRPGQADQAPQGQGGEAGEGEEKHPGGRHAPAAIPPPDTEEDSRLQMKEIRVQLIGGFKEQLEMRRSPVELESTSLELHVDVSHYLPTMAELGWSSVWPKPRRRPRRWSSCRPRRSSARTAGGAATACRARELEVEDTALQANSLCRKNLLCQKDFVIQCCQQHRRLCEQIIQDQRQLIQDVSPHLCFPDSHRRRPRAVPEALEQRYGLHSRELGVDTLNGLLRLHSVMSSALPVSPPQAQARARRRPLLPRLCASPGVRRDT
uniref:Kinesin motor domain-containing protein n=1 Tax=Balaenoptera musculus TaxID=9771 RepID=A0A8C0I5V1_BALMU